MLVYFLVFLVTMLIQFVSVSNQKQYLWRTIISFVPLFLFGALRVGGGDYVTYEDAFYDIHNLAEFTKANDHFELGYIYLCRYMPSWRVLVIFVSFLMCLGYGRLFYKYLPPTQTKIAFVLLFLSGNYTIYFVLSAMRNGLAVSLLMLAVPYIIERKWVPVAILGAIATSIHTSAMIAFTVAYLVGRTTTITKKEITVWMGIAMVILTTSVAGVLDAIEPLVAQYMDRYDSVIREIEEVQDHSSFLANVAAVVIGLFLLFVIKQIDYSKAEASIYRLSLLYPVSFLLGVLNTRVTQYYIIFAILFTAILCYRFRNRMLNFVFTSFLVLFMSYSFYLWTQSEWFTHQTYYSVFD